MYLMPSYYGSSKSSSSSSSYSSSSSSSEPSSDSSNPSSGSGPSSVAPSDSSSLPSSSNNPSGSNNPSSSSGPSCGPVPGAYTSPPFTEFEDAMTASGTISIEAYTGIDPECFAVDSVEVLGGSIDDFGTIGGARFQNNTPCVPGPGRISIIESPVEVDFTDDPLTPEVRVDWLATSDGTCGPPTGIRDVTFAVTFKRI